MTPQEINIPLTGLTKKQSLVTAFEAIAYLGWRIRFVSDAGVIAYTDNGPNSWNGEITVKVEGVTATIKCVSTSAHFDTMSQCNRAIEQYVAAFQKIRSALSDDEVHAKYELYEKDFVPPYEDTLKPDIRPKFNLLTGFWSYFRPKPNYFFTPVLVIVNIVIWVAMVCTGISVFDPTGQSVLPWGANSTVATLDGQWWRLITNCFLHFGILHLVLNMYALIFVGVLLEPFLGKAKFITAYLLTGIAASLASLWWHDYTVSAGASGAIFGLYGVFLAILTTNHIDRDLRNGLLASIGPFVLYNLIYGSFKGGIDNAAHIGGLLSGIVVGYMYLPALRRPDKPTLNITVIAFTLSVCIIGSAIGYSSLAGSDRVVYYKRINDFYKLEERAVDAVKNLEGKPIDQALPALQKGIVSWEQGEKLVKELDRLDVSTKIHHTNQLLMKYCQLRTKSYRLMHDAYAKNTTPDTDRLNAINQEVDRVLSELSSK